MYKNDFFLKVILIFTNLRYLGSGKIIFRLIAKGCDTYLCACTEEGIDCKELESVRLTPQTLIKRLFINH